MSSTISKRSALRFSGYSRTVRYRTDYEDGEAKLLNISTNGCALTNITTELSVGEKVLFIIELANAEDQLQIQALVIRSGDGSSAALQFLRINDEVKHRILHFFANEIRRRAGDQTTAA